MLSHLKMILNYLEGVGAEWQNSAAKTAAAAHEEPDPAEGGC